jgi:hypothetical protein
MNNRPTNIIPIEQCKHGYLYKIGARNLSFGVYNKDSKGFIGIRTKFGSRYLFTEFHWDSDPHFGTACPLKALFKVPPELEIIEHYSGSWDVDTDREVIFIKDKEGPCGKWAWKDTKTIDENISPCFKENKPLFDYLTFFLEHQANEYK